MSPPRLEPLPVELSRAHDAAARLASALGVLREKIVRGHEREAQIETWRRIGEAERACLRALERVERAAHAAGLQE